MAKKLSQDEFIKQVTEIHGDMIDFSNSVYINDTTPVECRCPKCGLVWFATPNNLKNKAKPRGCPKCNHMSRKYTLEEWLENANYVHGDLYDLSLITEYTGRLQKITPICKKHGVFETTAFNFLNGHGCPICARENNKKTQAKPFEQVVSEARDIHGDKYIYHEESYTNVRTPMKITCKIHGDFFQTPHKHIGAKHGCPMCGGSAPLTTEDVVKRVHDKFGDKYDTSKLEYVNANTSFILICKKHGEFKTTLRKLYDDTYRGCPKCNQSSLENEIQRLLEDNKIEFISQARKRDGFEWLGRLTLDFFLPKYNIAIECQGEQHYEPIKTIGGEEKFKRLQTYDTRKKQLCEKNNVKLLYFTHYKKIEEDNVSIFKDKTILIEHIKN